jgi:flagellar hook-basal body complex protein FliE
VADPLGLIRSVSPGSTVGGMGPLTPRPGATDPNAPSFKDVLMDNLKQVNKLQQEATTAIEDLATGKRNDVEGVLVATQKADLAFKMMLSVRNKVMAAYDEIKQFRV